MSGDGERNFLPIVAIVVVVIFAFALTAGAVVWRRQHIADSEARATSSPTSSPIPPPPTVATIESALPLASPSTTVDPKLLRELGNTGTMGMLADPSAPDPSGIPHTTESIARLRPGFRACYNKGLAINPNLEGSITIAIAVAPNGDITDVTKKSGSGLSADVETCILKRAKSATFDASPTGGKVTVPLKFVQAH